MGPQNPNPQEQPGAQPPDGEQPGAPVGVPDAGAQQADPKVVEAYQRIVMAAGKVVYKPDVSKGLLDMVRAGGDPITGVVHATLSVLDQIRGKIKGINPDFVYTGGPMVIGMVLELAEAAKLVQFDPSLVQKATAMLQQELAGRGSSGAPQPAAAPSAAPAPAAPVSPSGV